MSLRYRRYKLAYGSASYSIDHVKHDDRLNSVTVWLFRVSIVHFMASSVCSVLSPNPITGVWFGLALGLLVLTARWGLNASKRVGRILYVFTSAPLHLTVEYDGSFMGSPWSLLLSSKEGHLSGANAEQAVTDSVESFFEQCGLDILSAGIEASFVLDRMREEARAITSSRARLTRLLRATFFTSPVGSACFQSLSLSHS